MHTHDRRRRIVLRSMLATGFALCLPRPGAAESGKISKVQAQYQNQPKDDQKCGNCMHFIGPNACMVVEGDISPEGWCSLWVRKPG
ncbi:MAG: high-potential iron-sulfur protein [Gammaproteobacteria bacterium]